MKLETILPIIISGVMMIIAVITYLKATKKDNVADIQEADRVSAEIEKSFYKVNMKLDNLCSVTQNTSIDVKSMSKDINALDKKVLVLEQHIKSLEHRVDDLEKEGMK